MMSISLSKSFILLAVMFLAIATHAHAEEAVPNNHFVSEYNALENRRECEAFVARYGQRRTSENFCLHADWFNQRYACE